MLPIAEALAKVSTIVGVVTRPDAPKGRGKLMQPPPLKVWAASRGLQVLQPTDLRAVPFLESFRGMQPDLVLTAAYG
ncbi:MAG: methionyl-tRNA formyltransferase, partial [bacterium]